MTNKNNKYILTIDSGTTSVRTIIVNHSGQIVSVSQQEFAQYFPHSGWVEHNAMEIWTAQLSTIRDAIQKVHINPCDIVSIGITNQRETIVFWNKKTGTPCAPAIVWQDQRTSEYCESINTPSNLKMIHEKTGLLIEPYFSASKIKWALDNDKHVKETFENGELYVGTIDTWLIWNLTNGKSFVTDVTNASRTLLFNINTLQWDDELLKLFSIPKDILPSVKESMGDFGLVNPEIFSSSSNAQVRINGVLGDQQSSLFGQLCLNKGESKVTYGTGCFALLNIGEEIILSKNKLLTTIAWKLPNQKPIYALEGSTFIAGAAIKWLRDALKIIYRADEVDYYASIVKDDQEIFVVPSFTGLGAPYWDSYSRGAIFGIERETHREHLIKATIEAIAFQCNDLINTMEKDINYKISSIKVDGGVSQSNYVMQFQANISNMIINRPTSIEVTALGVTFLAGLGVKFWSNTQELKELNPIKTTFMNKIDESRRAKLIKGWREAVKRTLNWKCEI